MSTLKVDAIRHNSATSDAITTVADGTCTAKLTSIGGGGLSHRNMIINGGMIVSQRGTGALTVSNSGQNYQVDMYRGRAQGGGQFSIQQVTDAPSGTGLYNSSKLQVTAADTSIQSGDYYEFIQYIEGYNFLPTEYGGSGAKTCTLSFYVKSNVTGTHTGAIGNVGNNRGFGFNYTINSPNTWERKTITIPGDTTGTWNKANSVGAKIIFSLGIGANFATANVSTWETRETMGTDDGQNLIASTSNNLYLTGIQFEVGDTATSFEHRSIGDELVRCMRYYEHSYNDGITPGANSNVGGWYMCLTSDAAGNAAFSIEYKVRKRTAPVTAVFYADNGTANQWDYARNGASGKVTVNYHRNSQTHLNAYMGVGAGWTVCYVLGHWTVSAEF